MSKSKKIETATPIITPCDAISFVESLLNLKREGVITKDELKRTLKEIPYYCDIVN